MKKDIHYYLSKPFYRALLLFPPIIINFIILYFVILDNTQVEQDKASNIFGFSVYMANFIWLLIGIWILDWSDNKK